MIDKAILIRGKLFESWSQVLTQRKDPPNRTWLPEEKSRQARSDCESQPQELAADIKGQLAQIVSNVERDDSDENKAQQGM